MNAKDFMLDIETLSRKENPMVWSVGITEFSPRGAPVVDPVRQEYYVRRGEQIKHRRDIEAETVAWTVKHGDADGYAAWLRANDGEDPLTPLVSIQALHEEIRKLVNPTGENLNRVWVNGASFDFVHLRTLFRCADLGTPWHFRRECCMRTLRNLLPNDGIDIAKQVERPNHIGHRSSDDADFQAEWTQRMISALTKPEEVIEF